MSFSSPNPVASGQAYRVVSIDGSPPSALEQFIGVTGFVVAIGDAESQIGGQGSVDGVGVRFQEKDVDHAGKDVRVWQITEADDVFSATPIAAF
jgi:hypothetical protein